MHTYILKFKEWKRDIGPVIGEVFPILFPLLKQEISHYVGATKVELLYLINKYNKGYEME